MTQVMLLFQFRRAVMFSGVIVIALSVAIASIVFSSHHMDRLIAQMFPSTSAVAVRQLWQAPQQDATVSLNQISSSLSSAWTTSLSSDTIRAQHDQSSCNCSACQGITV